MGSGTGLGRVRGLGSAGHGSEHWLRQRTTAVGNLLLMIWLLVSLFRLPGFDHDIVIAWLAQPIVAVPMILLLVSIFMHMRLGLQVLIEDYVQDDGLKFASLIALNFYTLGLVATGIFAIAKIAFSGTPN
jgi:succinate dehydrogenase / fumarate reductase, membrane anchor subunit